MQTHAEPIEKAELDAFQHLTRYVAIRRLGREAREVAGRVGQKRSL
jgi:hypothetical protein